MRGAADPKGYYRILGVAPGASAEEIRAAFREQAKIHHPDHGGDAADEATFHRLREAYEVLRDPSRRMNYDAMADDGRASGSPHGPGNKPSGSAPSRRPVSALLADTRLTATLLGLAAALILLLGGLLLVTYNTLDERDVTLAEMYARLDQALQDQADVRARYRGSNFLRLEEALSASDGLIPALQSGFIFEAEVAFRQQQVEIDERLASRVDRAVVDLAGAIGSIPPDRDWMILIEGHTGRAAAREGIAVDAWELSLLRLASVLDYLVAQGLPTERLAVRFNAGFSPVGEPESQGGTVEIKLLCCFR